MKGRVSVKRAAELLNVSQQYIRMGLRSDRLSFGTAVKMSSVWTYHISIKSFCEYAGVSEDEIFNEVSQAS